MLFHPLTPSLMFFGSFYMDKANNEGDFVKINWKNPKENTMKKFKYPLAIDGEKSKLSLFFDELRKLGYRTVDTSYTRLCHLLVTDYAKKNGELGFGDIKTNPNRIIIPLENNRDLILALAATVDDNQAHVGEYWMEWDTPDIGWMWKVENAEKNSVTLIKLSYLNRFGGTDVNFIGGALRTHLVTLTESTHSAGWKKATKNQIINFFKAEQTFKEKHNMAPTSQKQREGGLAGAPQIGAEAARLQNQQTSSSLVEVPVSFVKEAHAAACADWKQRIEKVLPGLFRTYAVGQKFILGGTTFQIIGGTLNGMSLINLSSEDGLVINNSILVNDPTKISPDELRELFVARWNGGVLLEEARFLA